MIFSISRKQANTKNLWGSLEIGSVKSNSVDDCQRMRAIRDTYKKETHLNTKDKIDLNLDSSLENFTKDYFEKLGVAYTILP